MSRYYCILIIGGDYKGHLGYACAKSDNRIRSCAEKKIPASLEFAHFNSLKMSMIISQQMHVHVYHMGFYIIELDECYLHN